MPYRDIIFSGFYPDRGGAPRADDPGYLIQAENVVPTPHGYRTSYIDEAVGVAAVGTEPVSAAGFATQVDERHFAGGPEDLYESNNAGTTWNTNSRAGGYDPANGHWDFGLFEDVVIAVNGADEPQEKSLNDAVTTDFADLAGSPPIAGRVARVRDHLILGRLASNNYQIQWPGIGTVDDWETPGTAGALAVQAGSQEFEHEYGGVSDIVGGEKFGLVFQERAITRMTYVGGDIVFQFDTFERRFGTGHWIGAIQVGPHCYFSNVHGLFRTDGYQVEHLSHGHVDEAIVKAALSHPQQFSAPGMAMAYDSRNDAVYWPYIINDNSGYMLAYFIKHGAFSIINASATILQNTIYSVSDGASAESAKSIPYIFNSAKVLLSLTDITSIPIVFRTAFVELDPGFYTQVQGVEVLGKGFSLAEPAVKSISASTGIDLSASSYTATGSIGRANTYPIRKTGRFHSFKLEATVNADALFYGLRVHYERSSQK